MIADVLRTSLPRIDERAEGDGEWDRAGEIEGRQGGVGRPGSDDAQVQN